MIKEIVEFMELENNSQRFIDIILDNRSLAKGFHIIVDKDTFEIKECAYNDESDEFKSFVNKYDLKKREYYCHYLASSKNFDASPPTGKNQIHSASPYAIFFRYKNDISILSRLKNIQSRLQVTGYFEKIRNLTKDSNVLQHLKTIETKIKNELATKYFIKRVGKKKLNQLKNDDYVKIYFDYDLEYIKVFHNEYSPEMSFNAKGLFEDKDSYSTLDKYNCPIFDTDSNLGTSNFLNTFAPKKTFLKHLTIPMIYNGFSALYSGLVIQNLSLFEELLKLKLFPNPFPIFISNKDGIDNEGNKVYNGLNYLDS